MMWKKTIPVILALASAAPAQAQSLFATRGLGVPLPPVDARARSLGGIGVGLLGLNTSLVNPADIAGLRRRGVTAVLQPWSGSTSLGDETGDVNGTRFPMVRVFMPLGARTVLSLGFGSVLEQSWGVVIDGFEQVGGDSLATRDLILSNGGISQITLGLSYELSPRLAIGVSGGTYTGNLDRRITRTFTDTTFVPDPFDSRTRFNYQALQGSVGVRFDPAPFVRLGASLNVSPELDVDIAEGDGEDDKAELPYRLVTGASGWLSPELLIAVGAEYAWRNEGPVFGSAGTDPPASEIIARQRNTLRAGGGLEWEGMRSGSRVFPIRLGGSWAQLPYFDADESPATEWSGSLGLGFRLAGDEFGPLAVADATLERGGRSGLDSSRNPGGLSERFWRFTVSLALFGN